MASFAMMPIAMLRESNSVACTSLSGDIGDSTRLTTMTTSAHISRATSTGMFRTMPPSERTMSFRGTGENAPGIAMLARIAVARSPSFNTTMSPVTMSVATARNGIGSWSNTLTIRAWAT